MLCYGFNRKSGDDKKFMHKQTIVACNGKTYKQGDTLVVGKPASSGYLYMRSVDGQGSLSPVYERDIVGSKNDYYFCP